MDETDYESLEVYNSNIYLQGIFADIKNAITARIVNNTFTMT